MGVEAILEADGTWCCTLGDSDDDVEIDGENKVFSRSGYDSADDLDFGMSAKQLELYEKQVKESQGFDVDYFYDEDYCGIITPHWVVYPLRGTAIVMAEMAEMAINKYNADEGTHFKLHRLIKGNVQAVAGFIYYITFEAKDVHDDSTTRVFQAKAYDGIQRPRKVGFCRLKSSSNSDSNNSDSSNSD